MRAIIPVAGFGTRLRPHTYTLPKVLLNVAGKPIIAHIIDKIIEDGFDEATIIVGSMGSMIEEYLRSMYKIKLDFIQQSEPKGIAHAVHMAKHTFPAQEMLIILGDTIFDVDLKPVLMQDRTSLGVKVVDDPRRFGVVELKGERILRLIEKPEHPTTNLAIVGLYWIRNCNLLVDCIEELFRRKSTTKGEYQLTDALQLMIDRGENMTTFNVEGWYDCGKPETMLATNRHLLEGRDVKCCVDGSIIHSPSYISPTAKITNSIIGPYATVTENVTVNDSIVKNSIINEGAHLQHVMIENSLVGPRAIVRGAMKHINIGDSSEIHL